MTASVSTPRTDRLAECRRADALARHFRESEGLSIGQIADRLGDSPGVVEAFFYDPTGEKARAVKARYVGVCRDCGAYTSRATARATRTRTPRPSGPGAIARAWTQERVLEAVLVWGLRYGLLPSSYDWSSTHARGAGERGAAALEPRLLGVGERRHRCLGELVGGARCDWCSVERGRAAV